MGNKVLALYDFASKQEYIYRTSKIKEISGASALLSKMYIMFIEWLTDEGIRVLYKNGDGKYIDFDFELTGCDGQVLYDGGGNLMVLYKDKETYVKANKVISVKLLKEYPGLHMIASCVDVDGKNFFSKDIIVDKDDPSKNTYSDVTKLYRENGRQKGLHPASDMTGVIPMTQIDPMTFGPVQHKFNKNDKNSPYPTGDVSLSADRYIKAINYEKKNFADFDEGLVAVIYIDGNSMGNKLKSLAAESYDEGVKNLRFFSENVQNEFVTKPLNAIPDDIKCRKVIGGGDEITLICYAKDALNIVKTYFDSLNGKDSCCVIPDDCKAAFNNLVGATTEEQQNAYLKNTSCAGIAVVHAKSPFTVAYELAEAACESAKKEAHKNPENYFDFYYCHAGATADFKTLREREQSMTGRPYQFNKAMADFDRMQPILNLIGRANVKALGNAIQKGDTAFAFEIERVNSYLKKDLLTKEDKNLIYDMSEFYDIWFTKEGGIGDEKTTEDNT